MATISRQMTGEFVTRDGMRGSSSPQEALAVQGPLVPITINGPLNPGKSVSGLALLDTGADGCAISDLVVSQLGIIPLTAGNLRSYHDGEDVKTERYAVHFSLGDRNTGAFEVDIPTAFRINLHAEEIIAVVGRSILRYVTLIYFGREGRFVISDEQIGT